MEPYRGADRAPTTLNNSIFSTIPGSPAYVSKAEHYWRKTAAFDLPDVDLRGHNVGKSSATITAARMPSRLVAAAQPGARSRFRSTITV